eukprot:2101450-Prymnesium_polylepis.1
MQEHEHGTSHGGRSETREAPAHTRAPTPGWTDRTRFGFRSRETRPSRARRRRAHITQSKYKRGRVLGTISSKRDLRWRERGRNLILAN